MHGPATDVFLSYKAEDRARLVPLVEALEAEGFTVWWDAHIGGGTNWHKDIEEHLKAAKCVVVAWTKRSIGHDGDFVRDEARRAQKRDAYVPICLDGVEPPLGFGEIQSLSLKGWKGDRNDPRFQALADAVRSHISGEPISHSYAQFREPRVTRRGAIAGGIGVGAIAVAGAGGWLLFKPGAANAKRIAVMPFANLSGDREQSYFSDGIAEELRSALSRIGLEVIGRSSSDAVRDLDTKSAASKLGVGHILTGSVRRSPEVIRVNAQLLSGSDGVQLWAQTYDRAPGDAIKIQSDIAERVAEALSVALGETVRAAIALGGTSDSMAQDLLLQSRQVRRTEGLISMRQSLALARAALARDPNYAEAHVEEAISLLALSQHFSDTVAETNQLGLEAVSAASKAVSLAPRLGAAHAVLAWSQQNRLNYRVALREIERALALSTDDPNVLTPAARLLVCLADGNEALRLADRFIAVDPLNRLAYQRKAEVLKFLRRYEAAVDVGQQELDLASDVYIVRSFMGDSLTLLGRHDEALAQYAAMPADEIFRLTGEALVAARTRDHAGAQLTIDRMKRLLGPTASYQYAEIFAQLGNADRAFAELTRAIQVKDSGLIYLKVDPFLDPIRGDPRYAALLKRLKFPT